MASWKKERLPREDGRLVDMSLPVIVSASRSTDIPAFYVDWFFHRLDKVGYSAWTNPFNGMKSYVSYRDTRFIVFWSKNPIRLLLTPHPNDIIRIIDEQNKLWINYFRIDDSNYLVPKEMAHIVKYLNKYNLELSFFGHVTKIYNLKDSLIIGRDTDQSYQEYIDNQYDPFSGISYQSFMEFNQIPFFRYEQELKEERILINTDKEQDIL